MEEARGSSPLRSTNIFNMITPDHQPGDGNAPQNQTGNGQIDPEVLKKVVTAIKVPFSCFTLPFVLVGFGLFLWGLSSFSSHVRLLISGVHTSGIVVDAGETVSRGKRTYNPTIEFVTREQQTIRYKSDLSTDMLTSVKGQPVEIIYMPDKPHEAAINEPFNLWVMPLLLLCFGGMFLGVSITKLYNIWRASPSGQNERKPFDKSVLARDSSFSTYIFFTVAGLFFLGLGIYVSVTQYQSFAASHPGSSGIMDFLSDKNAGALLIVPFSFIFVGVGAGGLVSGLLRKKRNETLKLTGRKAVTTVVAIEYTNTRINRVTGRKIVSEYRSESGASVRFFSQPYYVPGLEEYVKKGDKVDVYIDPARPEKYFMDVENLTSA